MLCCMGFYPAKPVLPFDAEVIPERSGGICEARIGCPNGICGICGAYRRRVRTPGAPPLPGRCRLPQGTGIGTTTPSVPAGTEGVTSGCCLPQGSGSGSTMCSPTTSCQLKFCNQRKKWYNTPKGGNEMAIEEIRLSDEQRAELMALRTGASAAHK